MRAAGVLFLVALLGLSACATPKGDSVDEQRRYVQKMRDDTLNRFYASNPALRDRVARAAGYGVFSDLALRLFVLGGGHGYGVIRDNKSGRDTYMRMGQLELGIGFGLRDFRALFVFRDAATLRTFVESGWQFGGNAEASAIVSGDKGVAVGAQGTVAGGGAAAGTSGGGGAGSRSGSTAGSLGTGLEVYQLTDTGLVLSAGIAGTKYWRDGDLN